MFLWMLQMKFVITIASIFAIGTAFADEPPIMWSLSPKTEKFPCDAVILKEDGMRFVKPMIITCKGAPVMSLIPHGSLFDGYFSFVCKEPLALLLSGKVNLDQYPDNLLYTAQKDCRPQ